jgi:hypothetical protein
MDRMVVLLQAGLKVLVVVELSALVVGVRRKSGPGN